MRGIDIFSGQGKVDFAKVKADGIEVVYIKATEGVTYTDPTVKSYYMNAKAAGLKVGFYHFLRANNPIAEAQHFLDVTNGMQVDCKYAIDVEVTLNQSEAKISANVRQFADYLISKGKEVCLYTYLSFYRDNLNDSVKDLPLWIAEYGVNSPRIAVPYVGFQYSDTGSVSGISGNVDLDLFSYGIFIGNNSSTSPSAPVMANNDSDTIKNIQKQLNLILKKNLAVDGMEGQKTDSAIRDFQRIMGLKPDGIVGPNTSAAINEILDRPADGVNYPHYEYATRYIQYRVGAPIDGIYGNLTKAKVQNWQAANGLTPDGIVGSLTWSKLLGE
ncbi:MAG: GH25 family lysozyme [Bacillota bacterium]|nr:GH25 family lysozyme [Bacillota bacterium]